MSAAQPGWQVKGVYHETCASEGHCPYYFGRDKEGGCRYFMVFRITEGQVGGVDLAGVTAVYLGDLPYATYAEVATKGSHGAAYISDTATPHQRAVLDTLAVRRSHERSLGGQLRPADGGGGGGLGAGVHPYRPDEDAAHPKRQR